MHLHLAVGGLAVHADALFGAALGQAAAGGQGLHQRHAALQPHGAGALHLAVDVDQRLAVDPHGVAVLDQQVLVAGRRRQTAVGRSTSSAEGLAVARAGDAPRCRRRSAAVPPAMASRSVRRMSATSMRVAAGAVDLAQHAGLVAAHLQHHQGDLRLLDEVAVAQAVGDQLLGRGDGQAAQADGAQQRVADTMPASVMRVSSVRSGFW